MNKLLALAVCVSTCTPVPAPAWAASKSVILAVPSMDCPVCPITVTKALTRVGGVSRAQVDFDKRQVTVTFDDAKVTVERSTTAKREAGNLSTLAADAK